MINIKEILVEKIKYNLSKINNTNYLVLKSNAYGFGLKEILKLVKKTNIYKFCVINLDDAIVIRKKIINAKILLITPYNKELLHYYKKYKIELSINNKEEFKLIKEKNMTYQLVVNTGMNRFGINDITSDLITSNLSGIYSHNATNEMVHIQNQIEKFKKITDKFKDIDIHYFSSQHQNLSFGNCRRIGENIYKDALVIKANVIHFNHVKKGEYIGYDYSYKAKKDMIIGVLDIGYADGLIRNCSGYKVYAKSHFFELVGKSCMNHCFVYLDRLDIKEIEIISKNNPIENYENFFNITKHEIFLHFSLSKNYYL